MTDPKELIESLPKKTQALRDEIAKTIVGQGQVVEDVLLGLYCGEHTLLTGVPGLAKTLLVRSLASVLDLGFNRIQFTPDSDACGHYRYGNPPGRPCERFTRTQVHARAGLYEPPPGRRD